MEPVNPYAAPQASSEAVSLSAAEQPFTIRGALGEGTWLCFRRFPTLAAVTLSVYMPLELFVSYQEYFVVDPDDTLGVLRWSVLTDGLIGIIAIGGVISVAEAELRGEHRGWLSGLSAGLQGWLRLFSSRFVGGLLMLIAALLFVLPGIYLAIRYSLSDAAAIIEGRAGISAISRSMELTRDRFLAFLGLCLVTVVPVVIFGGVIFMPFAFLPELDHWLVSAALSCVIDLLTSWINVVFVLAYLQCRAEERRMEQPRAPAPTASVLPPSQPYA